MGQGLCVQEAMLASMQGFYSSSQVSVCLWFGLPSIFPNIQWQVCFEFRHETEKGDSSKHAHFVLFCPLAKAILILFPMGPCSKTLVSMAGLFIVKERSMVAPERGWLKFHRQSDVNLLDMQANRFDVLSVFWSCCKLMVGLKTKHPVQEFRNRME